MPYRFFKFYRVITCLNTAYQGIDGARKVFLPFFIFLVTTTACAAQKSKIESKIDPQFWSLIKASNEVKTTSKKKCFWKKKNKASTESKINKDEVKYDCIVYTKNADAVRSKGIIINSVLSTFITAKASLQQIREMALMKEVSYIASPGEDHLDSTKEQRNQ